MLFLFIVCSNLFGQYIKYRDVTVNDLSPVADKVFKDAPAVVMNRDIHFIYGRVLYVKERKKIINKDGFNYATEQIPFSDIENLKAYIYSVGNGKVIKTPLSKKDIFIEKVDKDSKITKLVFPNVKKGSILEFSYKVDYIITSSIFTQSSIPIKKIKVTIENSSQRELKFSQNPLSSAHLNLNSSLSQQIYTGKNIEELKDEDYVYNIDNYRGKIYIEKVYLYKNDRLKTWGDIAMRYNLFSWFGEELKKSGSVYKKNLKKIIAKETDTLEMAKIIYYYVQKEIDWDKSLSRGSENIRKTYVDKKGDTGDLNFLLISMIRNAGIEANPVLLSSRSNGMILSPTISKFNAAITAVEINDALYLLDPSRKYAAFGELNTNLMNGDGFIVYKDGSYRFVSLYTSNMSKKIALVNTEFDVENESISGSVKMRLNNYQAWDYRYDFDDLKEEDYVFNLERRVNLLEVSNFKGENVKDLERPISLSYNFEYSDFIEIIHDDIYFKPMLYFGISNNRFTEEHRRYPINTGYPEHNKYIVNFKIPEGYKLINMPKGRKIILENNYGSFEYNVQKTNNTIQVTVTLNIRNMVIPAEYYKGLKEMFSEYLLFSESRIVLSKI